jgi:hypothetical protein
MCHDLMPVKVEIDPVLGASSLGAAEQFAVEPTCGCDVVHWKGQVERRQAHASALQSDGVLVEAFVAGM